VGVHMEPRGAVDRKSLGTTGVKDAKSTGNIPLTKKRKKFALELGYNMTLLVVGRFFASSPLPFPTSYDGFA
jgi:hypothetical protein